MVIFGFFSDNAALVVFNNYVYKDGLVPGIEGKNAKSVEEFDGEV